MANCKVHGLALKWGKADIRYGMPPAPPVNYFEASETLFPHARSFEVGGCLIDDKRSRRVRFCPECREAERTWMDLHGEKDDFWSP